MCPPKRGLPDMNQPTSTPEDGQVTGSGSLEAESVSPVAPVAERTKEVPLDMAPRAPTTDGLPSEPKAGDEEPLREPHTGRAPLLGRVATPPGLEATADEF